MKITANKVASIHYTLKDKNGELIDTSDGKPPLAYIHGVGNLIPGMEKALDGKSVGDQLSLVIDPAEAYGIRDEELVQVVPIENFPDRNHVKAGMRFVARSPEGSRQAVILLVEGENVTVDFNHPLADVELHFSVEVMDVREATEDELGHGHIHGEGCNH